MNLENQILFFFSALGAFNGLLLSIYVFVIQKPKSYLNIYLGALLAALSIRIGKSIFFYFNPDLSKIYLQIGLSACFLIGPFLYFYLKTSTVSVKKSALLDRFHLSSLVLIILVVGIIYPYENYSELWGTVFYKMINYQWSAYLVFSFFILKKQFEKEHVKNLFQSAQHTWMTTVFSGVFIIWCAYFFASYTSYIVGAMSFTFILYITVLLVYHKSKTSKENNEITNEKYLGVKIDEERANELHRQIETIILEEELYKNSNLTITDLSKRMKVRSHTISQLLNDNLNKNFSLFINEYRIQEAKRILDMESNLKMEIISEMCGFNSLSTFYTAFKKLEGTTPAQYAKN